MAEFLDVMSEVSLGLDAASSIVPTDYEVLWQAGIARKAHIGSKFQAMGPAINPRLPPFNAKGIYGETVGLQSTAGSTLLTGGASGTWRQEHVGVDLWVTNSGASTGIQKTTIASVSEDGSQINMTDPAVTTFTGNKALWLSDDTAAIQAALDFVARPNVWEYGGTVILDRFYGVRGVKMRNRTSLVGLSPHTCGLVAYPGMTGPVLSNANLYDDFQVVADIGIHGQKYYQGTSANIDGYYYFGAGSGLRETDVYNRYRNVHVKGAQRDGFFYGGPRGETMAENINTIGSGRNGLSWNGYDCTISGGHHQASKNGGYFGSQCASLRVNNVKFFYSGNALTSLGEGANLYVQGQGIVFVNCESQESASHGVVIAAGHSHRFTDLMIHDTGCVKSGVHGGAAALPSRRAALEIAAGVRDCKIDALVTHGLHQSYMTHGIMVQGTTAAGNRPNNNYGDIRTRSDQPDSIFSVAKVGYAEPEPGAALNPDLKFDGVAV